MRALRSNRRYWPEELNAEANLWVAVIIQALSDATLGYARGLPSNYQRKCLPRAYTTLTPAHVDSARDFILGRTTMLEEICEMLGMDYTYIKRILREVYNGALPFMPRGSY